MFCGLFVSTYAISRRWISSISCHRSSKNESGIGRSFESGVPGGVAVDEAGLADGADDRRDVRHVGELAIKPHLAPAEPAPQPDERHAAEIGAARHLQHDAPVRLAIGR